MSTTPAVESARDAGGGSDHVRNKEFTILAMTKSSRAFTRRVYTSRNCGRLMIGLTLLLTITGARAVVFPNRSTPGAIEKYSLRVINEREVPTLRVEIHFPEGVRVVAFGEVPGWKLQIVTDSAQRITGAVWTGILPKQQFIEFPFVAVNPRDSTSLAWPTTQTYQGGEVVQWTNPDTASKTPVSSTLIADTTPPPLRVSRRSLYISLAALLFALTALAVALRPRGVDVNP